jgi:DNA replication ATP-dependent helicase Dna2
LTNFCSARTLAAAEIFGGSALTATHDANHQDEQRECFLCLLDPRPPCATARISGRILAATERVVSGEKVAVLVLDTGTERIQVHLDGYYYRSFVSALKALSDVLGSYHLNLRIYHLPTPPVEVESRGRTYRLYRGNAYTLAVLEPDTLLNITDLNQAEYCARQYLLNRLLPSTASTATVRGNLVHYSFKELLKEYDRGKLTSHADETLEGSLTSLHRHLDQALQLNALELALAGVTPETMQAEAAPHLESLAQWFERERNTLWDMPSVYRDASTEDDDHDENGKDGENQNDDLAVGNQVRAETFLLAPEIGLRGRLDLFWQQAGRQRLLELKTGGATGNLPKRDHRWQVYGYHALLTVRRNSKMKRALATLLYSGTPGSAQAFGIPATIREIQRVNETRNILVLGRVTSIPPAPPGPHRCSKCAMLESCQQVSTLLDWEPPQPDPEILAKRRQQAAGDGLPPPPTPPVTITADDRAFFARYYQLLHQEGRAGELQQALLWQLSVAERIERGTAISGLELLGRPVLDHEGWVLTFRCQNTSELREGDEILLSSGDPITSEVVSGTIMGISTEQVTVWTRELIAHAQLIDRYDNDLVHVRTLQNLLRWQRVPPHLRDLVAGRIRPRFLMQYPQIPSSAQAKRQNSILSRPASQRDQVSQGKPETSSHFASGERITPRLDFNREQNLAIERALQMQDYLLIHGPPGTGKTSVIAEIVKRLVQQGKRVMLAGFTNQAVDNMLKRLAREGYTNFLRLGHERSVSEAIRPHLLKELATPTSSTRTEDGKTVSYEESVRDLLATMPVVASTTATWSSDRYNVSQHEGGQPEDSGLYFDVAIIDEAGQLTVPAILGALRFARRFILVGDEKQLPPLVLSAEAAASGLADSLFSYLKRLDEEYIQEHPMAISACVPLRVQYRMNKWIANFSSTVFYDRQLVAHEAIANRRLVYQQHNGRNRLDEDENITRALDPQLPLVFLDMPDAAEGERMGSGETKQSATEARTVRALVAGLLARGIALPDIGIIAPYRAQVANIRRHLFSTASEEKWPGLPSDAPISVDTVDRFQGGERPVIIMSFATLREPPPGNPRREFLVNPHRLNVALTRAQCKLILVGCVPALEPLSTFNRLITYCRSMNTLITQQNAVLQTEEI